MKQKSFSVLLVTGLLCLSSCISNTESQSVTDLRNARVEQARAQAELLRAQAAVQAAQASMLNAQAAYQQALATAQELQNTIGEASARQQIANILAQMEVDALNNQVALINAQQALDAALAGQTTAQATLISTILTSYTDYYNQLSNARINLLLAQTDLQKIEKNIYNPNEAAYRQLNTISQTLANLIKEYDALVKFRETEREELKEQQLVIWEKMNEASLLHSEAVQAELDLNTKLADQRVLLQTKTEFNMLMDELTAMQTTNFNKFLTDYIQYTAVTEGGTTYGGTLIEEFFGFASEFYFETPPAAGSTTPGRVFLYNTGDFDYWGFNDSYYYPEPVDGVYPNGRIMLFPERWYSRNFNLAGFTAIYEAAKAALAGDGTALTTLENAWAALTPDLAKVQEAKTGYDAQVAIYQQIGEEKTNAEKRVWDINNTLTTLLAEYNAITAILNLAYTGYAVDGTAWTMTIDERLAALLTEIDTQKQALDAQWAVIITNDFNIEQARQFAEDELAFWQTQVEVLEKIVAALKAQLDAAFAEVGSTL